jgi:hypothetical protein
MDDLADVDRAVVRELVLELLSEGFFVADFMDDDPRLDVPSSSSSFMEDDLRVWDPDTWPEFPEAEREDPTGPRFVTFFDDFVFAIYLNV